MKLKKLLSQKKSSILKRWRGAILETYPADTNRFLKRERDQFANPVGHNISEGTESFYKELLHEGNTDSAQLSVVLDKIIRIRAIQDFSPSQAVSFVLMLKSIIRDELKGEIEENDLFDELLTLYAKIDEMALIAFDVYVKCREKIYEIKVSQAKNQVYSLLRKAGFVSEIPEWEPQKQEDNPV